MLDPEPSCPASACALATEAFARTTVSSSTTCGRPDADAELRADLRAAFAWRGDRPDDRFAADPSGWLANPSSRGVPAGYARVDQLERAGYVERTPDPRDGRARLVRVAERGAAAVQASMSVVAEVEARWTAHLGETRTVQLRQALTMLREVTDPYEATDWRSRPSRG